MQTYKRLTLSIITGIFLIISLVMLINYIVDPFEIFGTKILKHQFQVNERYAKIEYLKNNHQKYNSYLLGSSRIGTTAPTILEHYIPNSKFYNISVAAATLYDNQILLQYLIDQKYDIKNIYLQVDILDNFIAYKHNDSDLLFKHHPNVIAQDYFHYYLSYLISLPINNISQKIIINLQNKDNVIFDINNTGVLYRIKKDKEIYENHELYIQNEPTFHTYHSKNIYGTQAAKNIIEFQKIQNLCLRNHINLIVFITPHNQNMMNSFVLVDYYNFRQELSYLTNYWDFSGYNSITKDDYNYYEDSHYTYQVAKIIAARIFDDTTVNIPDDFGIFITKNNKYKHN